MGVPTLELERLNSCLTPATHFPSPGSSQIPQEDNSGKAIPPYLVLEGGIGSREKNGALGRPEADGALNVPLPRPQWTESWGWTRWPR